MQEELLQFKLQEVWTLVDLPYGKRAIDSRQESECHDQEKLDNVNSTNNVNVAGINRVSIVGINTRNELPFDLEMTDLEDISAFNFPNDHEDVDEMADMNNLDTAIQEELLQFKLQEVWTLVDLPYGKRAIGFEDPDFPDKVYKVEKVLYGLHQAPRAWNKARLVAQGHTQEEGIDYEEVFAPVARIEAVRLFLAYASFMGFMVYQMDVKGAFLYGTIEEKVGQIDQTLFIKKQKGDILLMQIYVDDIIFGATNKDLCKSFKKLMKDKFQISSMGELTFFLGLQAILAYASFKDFVVYQMDVKSVFLYGKIEEEVYVCQHPGFKDPDFLEKVYKVEKALYGLHQAPRAWYETLSTYLLDNGFHRGKIDKTLFIRRHKDGELTFFLGFQMKQKQDGIFISQNKHVAEIIKKYVFLEVKNASTPMETQKLVLKDEDGEEVDVHMYRSMISLLLYLTSLRPDIMFLVCASARYQVNPKVSQLYDV
nr:hypothetical protein [Tanacetum cinerariifolium]